jgi:YebC/PmpR family DNA-binding regulatory protein
LLVFVPGIGFEHGGAKRWLVVAGFSFQPSEILKYASVLLLSAFYSFYHENFESWKYRILPAIITGIFVLLVLKEPDLGTSTIILSGIFGVFFIVNAKWKDLIVILLFAIPLFTGFYMYYPHAKERVNTFLFPEKNTSDQNYQANQTKISLGSGGIWGDGYGKSIQKFHNLPEPIGDSIYAVIYEGYGPFGTAFLVEAATDNTNRTVSNIKHIFSKHEGNLGAQGSVAWQFSTKGQILVERADNLEELELTAIDAGADDVRESTEGLEVYTTPEKLNQVKEALKKAGAKIAQAEIIKESSQGVDLTEDQKPKVDALFEALENDEDVTAVHTSASLTLSFVSRFALAG